MDGKERTARYRARLRGEAIPREKPGPKPGYEQSPAHVAKRKRWGADHYAWQGEAVSKRVGHQRALRRFAATQCGECGAERAERHHIDHNPVNNDPANIAILCRRCHMAAHRR